jgi:hypothetical protein
VPLTRKVVLMDLLSSPLNLKETIPLKSSKNYIQLVRANIAP